MGFNEFREKVLSDAELAEKVKAFTSLEEAVEFAKGMGYTFTVEDIKLGGKLTDDELDAVAGGSTIMAKNYFIHRRN